MLERAALLLMHRNRFSAAAAVFCFWLRENSSNANGYYGLGISLFCHGSQAREIRYLNPSISCLKRAVEIDRDHEPSLALLAAMDERTPLSNEDVLVIPAFEGEMDEFLQLIDYDSSSLVREIMSLEDADERMTLLMVLSGLELPFSGEIIIESLEDPSDHVRMAALKRLDPSNHDPRIRASLEKLAYTDEGDRCQPYLMMALERIAENSEEETWAAEIFQTMKSRWET